MKRAEVRRLLETFWALEGKEKEEYFRAEILPHFAECFRTLNNKFIRQVASIMETTYGQSSRKNTKNPQS